MLIIQALLLALRLKMEPARPVKIASIVSIAKRTKELAVFVNNWMKN